MANQETEFKSSWRPPAPSRLHVMLAEWESIVVNLLLTTMCILSLMLIMFFTYSACNYRNAVSECMQATGKSRWECEMIASPLKD